MSKWQEKTKRPVLPIYMAALVWPIMALLLPIYTLGGLVFDGSSERGGLLCGHTLLPHPRCAGARRLRHGQRGRRRDAERHCRKPRCAA